MPSSNLFVTRLVGCVLLFVAALGLAGCGGNKTSTDGLTGKCTLNGQNVSGEVVLISSDKKEYKSPIGADGSYSIMNAPKGDYQICVRSLGAGVIPTKSDEKAKTDIGAGPQGGGGVPAPAKYAQPGNPLGTVSITGGKQEKNLTLEP